VFTQNGNTQDQNFAVIEEVRYLHDTLELRPTCVIGYDRLALAGTEYESDLRVTFDTDLTCRVNNPSLICRDNIHNHLFFPPQLCVMEIKIDHRVPYWLTEITAKFGCILRRISKYCTALEHTELPLTPF
jgi:hypothetical protein